MSAEAACCEQPEKQKCRRLEKEGGTFSGESSGENHFARYAGIWQSAKSGDEYGGSFSF
jgi:hypothetical protein